MTKYYELIDNWGFNWNYESLENACKHITDYVNSWSKQTGLKATYGYRYNAETETYIYSIKWSNGTIDHFTIETIK